ncbi:MAG: glycosyltransferase family 9 protein [Candidatus Dactylopiibacterium sp.]|nr:glycosyltransferase family 9 protein [Candidatus Dactylopiibacterium sp.]
MQISDSSVRPARFLAFALAVFIFACHFAHMKGLQWTGLVLALGGLAWLALRAGCAPWADFPRPVVLSGLAWLAWAALTLAWSAARASTLELVATDVLLPWLGLLCAYVVGRGGLTARLPVHAWAVATVGLAAITAVALSLDGHAWLASGDANQAVGGALMQFYPGPGLQTTFVVLGVPLLLAGRAAGWFPRPLALLLAALLVFCAFATANRMVVITLGVIGLLVLTCRALRAWRTGAGRRALVKPLAMMAGVLVLIVAGVVVTTVQRGAGDEAQPAPEVVAGAFGKDERLTMWRYWADVALQRPVFGHGYGKPAAVASHDRTHPLFASIRQPEITHPHNLLLSLWVQTGVIGVALFALFFACLFREGWRAQRRCPDGGVGLALMILPVAFLSKNLTDDFFDRIVCNLVFIYAGLLLGLAAWQARGRGVAQAGAGASSALRILILRRDNIGDLVVTLPMIRRLREHFPHAWIGALVTRYNAEVLHGSPDLDAVYHYTKAKHLAAGESAPAAMRARLALLWTLRRQRIDVVLLPVGGAQASARRMCWLIGAKRVVTRDEAGLPEPSGPHEAQRTARVLAALGVPESDLPAARIVPQAGLLAAARATLGTGPVLGLHISSRKPSQRWPAERFVALVQRLHAADPALRFALFWAPGASDNPLHPGDDAKAAQILAACAGVPLVAMPTDSLASLIAGLAACSRVLCSDGGHMHLAAALGKPLVSLFGKSEAARWHPWGVPYRLLQPASQDVTDVSVDEVMAALAELPGRS